MHGDVKQTLIGHFRVPLCLCFKVQNHSYENDYDLHGNETTRRTHFHMKGFALQRLVLKQWHKRTRKWPIKVRVRSQGFHWHLLYRSTRQTLVAVVK